MTIMERVQKKLDDADKAKKLKFLGSVLNRLSDEKYRPKSTDMILNPLSNFKTVAEKRLAFNRALDNKETALINDRDSVPLGTPDTGFNDVDCVGGLWRKQYKFPHKTVMIQDKEFVLLNKLERQEHTGFEFYNASSVVWTAMGKHCDFQPNFIIAKRKTNRGTFYAYGCYITEGKNALSKARSHLACKLFDVFQDVFEAEMGIQK